MKIVDLRKNELSAPERAQEGLFFSQETGMIQAYRTIKVRATDVLDNITQHLNLDANSIVIILLSVMLFSQFCLLTYSISMNADSWPIMNAQDNDVANAIRVSENSFWLKNNGFYPYGNLYFNMAQTVALFDPFSGGLQFNGRSLASDKGHHFALMLVSLCSLYGIASVISGIVARSMGYRLLTLFVLIGVFIKNEYWTTYIFRAHPDMLFSFFVALALYLTVKYMITKLDVHFNLSALAWGLALATKLTAVFFLPMLIILFIPPVTRANLAKSFRYYTIMLISYVVAGFPQNLMFWRHISFLRTQSNLSVSPTIGSVSEMLRALTNQSVLMIAAIIILGLIVRFFEKEDPKTVTAPIFARACALVMLPLVVLLSQRILTTHEHYTLPIASCLIVLAAFFTKLFSKNTGAAATLPAPRKTVIIALMLVSLLFFRLSPNAASTVLADQMEGRADAHTFVMELSRYQKENFRILADPYVPWDGNLGNVSESFFRTIEDIRPGKADILALSKNYYGRYLQDPPSLYVQKDIPSWRDVCKFYALFADKDRTVDPYGKTWVKVYANPRGWEIWKSEK